ncbi:uridine kinase [Pleurocapsales cyanobacterium LEGE 10410]|nr:uridine kinase [Pleurocapsales cyanobacterium LEGE 10410]
MIKANYQKSEPRVLHLDYLLNEFNSFPRKQSSLIVGVDGCGASGKSTFAHSLAQICTNITIVEMDDFYFPSDSRPSNDSVLETYGEQYDWKRIYKQVLKPISQNCEGFYQKYDWNFDTLNEFRTVPTGGIVIVEGIYSTRQELSHLYDFRIWVQCPYDIRLTRGVARDEVIVAEDEAVVRKGEDPREMWEKIWMPQEQRYIKAEEPYKVANLIIDGSGTIEHDPHSQFVSISRFEYTNEAM